jgi:hypothetical protein
MTSFLSLSLPQIVFGLLLYWIFPGWLVRQELERPEMPSRSSRGSVSFLFGQAAALVGICATGGLLGLSISPWIHRYSLLFASFFSLAALFLLQVRWILLGQPLDAESEGVAALSFREGRDLMLRHGLPLFLVFALLVSADSASAARRQLLGIFLGWAGTNSLWGTSLGAPAGNLIRKTLAGLAFLAALAFLLKSWRSFL